MEQVKYKNYKLGKATEISAKIIRWISIFFFIASIYNIPQEFNRESASGDFFLRYMQENYPERFDEILAFDKQLLREGQIVAIFAPILFAILPFILSFPLSKMHKNTILFVSHKMSIAEYKKKRVFCWAASIIFGVIGWTFWVMVGAFLAVPFLIFLAKTKPLLQEREQKMATLPTNSLVNSQQTDRNEEDIIIL